MLRSFANDASDLAVRSIDFDHLDTSSVEVPREALVVGAGVLDPNGVDLGEGSQPVV